MDSIDKFLERARAAFPFIAPDNISVYQYAGRKGIGHNVKIWDVASDSFIQVRKCSSEKEAIEQIGLAVKEFKGGKKAKKEEKIDDFLEGRDHAEDFAFLKGVFDGKELRWNALESAVYPGYATSTKKGRKLIGYWIKNWLIIKKGIDRSPDARYVLGEEPK